jgi:predicted nucleic acid-binding protein
VERTVFLDTGYAIALVSTRDHYHEVAKRLGAELKSGSHKIVTTDAVILEIGAAFARQAYRSAGIKLIDGLKLDPTVEIVGLDRPLVESAYGLFKERPDKDWSLADCISFVLMRERGISEALTADEHFGQAGFRALLVTP